MASDGDVNAVQDTLKSATLHNDSATDPYRSYLYDDSEKDTVWRHGGPPNYINVNKVFENGRTQEWKEGSLERIVENLVKTWEMEVSHKSRVQDHKAIDASKFSFSVNGGPRLRAEECLQMGSYNALLASSLPGQHEGYKAAIETFESSHDIFTAAFPDGFAWEVLAVFSGPPVVAFKYRHWGFMKGSFKGHHPTGDMVESFGVCVAKVDENLKITGLEVYFDPTQFLAGLTKGEKSPEYGDYKKGVEGCPFLNAGGTNGNPQIVH